MLVQLLFILSAVCFAVEEKQMFQPQPIFLKEDRIYVSCGKSNVAFVENSAKEISRVFEEAGGVSPGSLPEEIRKKNSRLKGGYPNVNAPEATIVADCVIVKNQRPSSSVLIRGRDIGFRGSSSLKEQSAIVILDITLWRVNENKELVSVCAVAIQGKAKDTDFSISVPIFRVTKQGADKRLLTKKSFESALQELRLALELAKKITILPVKKK